jgi:hypothetical protein
VLCTGDDFAATGIPVLRPPAGNGRPSGAASPGPAGITNRVGRFRRVRQSCEPISGWLSCTVPSGGRGLQPRCQ